MARNLKKRKPLYILTYKGRAVTLGQALKVREKQNLGGGYADNDEAAMYFAAGKRNVVRDNFIHWMGFTWTEWRKDGFAIKKKTA